MVFLNHGVGNSETRVAFLMLLTTMNPEVFFQMVLVFEGLATFSAFELAVAGCLVEQLVLREREGDTFAMKTMHKHLGVRVQ